MVSSKNTHTSNNIKTEQILFGNIYVYTYTYMHVITTNGENIISVTEHKQGYMGRFRRKKGKGEL